MKHFSFLLLLSTFLITSNTSNGQNSQREIYKAQSQEQIEQLHSGALLVRLQTRKSSIEALRKIGKDELADKKQSEQNEHNKEIIKAFKEDFDFCPVYFFFSDFSDKVRNDEIDQVEFLNENLEHDPSIQMNENSFLTAEVSNIKQDTAKYLSNQRSAVTKDGLKTQNQYYGGSAQGFGALIIMSDQFIQLSKPFPYYVRSFNSIFLKRSMTNLVDIMNEKLHKFYEKSKG